MSRQILIAAGVSDIEIIIEKIKEQGGWICKSFPHSTYVSRDVVNILAEYEGTQVVHFCFGESADREITVEAAPIRPHARGLMMYPGRIYVSTLSLESDNIRQVWDRVAAFTRKHFIKRIDEIGNRRRITYVGPSAKLWLEEQSHFLYCC